MVIDVEGQEFKIPNSLNNKQQSLIASEVSCIFIENNVNGTRIPFLLSSNKILIPELSREYPQVRGGLRV